jgi:hypothetical protein
MEDEDSWLYGDSPQTSDTPKDSKEHEPSPQNPTEVNFIRKLRS